MLKRFMIYRRHSNKSKPITSKYLLDSKVYFSPTITNDFPLETSTSYRKNAAQGFKNILTDMLLMKCAANSTIFMKKMRKREGSLFRISSSLNSKHQSMMSVKPQRKKIRNLMILVLPGNKNFFSLIQ